MSSIQSRSRRPKKSAVAWLAAAALLGGGSLAACGDDDDGITVVDGDLDVANDDIDAPDQEPGTGGVVQED